LRGSGRPVLTGGFAVTVAQVSVSSKDVERSRGGSTDGSELRRRAVVQRRVRTLMIVVAPPETSIPA